MELHHDIDVEKDKVELEGKVLTLPSNYVYYKLNKPKGYLCSRDDGTGRKTIYDLVKSDVRLFSIGRLDYDTEGLIILTNDGDVAQSVAHPSSVIEKEYNVTIEGNILESELAVLRNGVVEKGVRLPKAKVEVIEKTADETKLKVIIHEGKNRQIRRTIMLIDVIVILQIVGLITSRILGKAGRYTICIERISLISIHVSQRIRLIYFRKIVVSYPCGNAQSFEPKIKFLRQTYITLEQTGMSFQKA